MGEVRKHSHTHAGHESNQEDQLNVDTINWSWSATTRKQQHPGQAGSTSPFGLVGATIGIGFGVTLKLPWYGIDTNDTWLGKHQFREFLGTWLVVVPDHDSQYMGILVVQKF